MSQVAEREHTAVCTCLMLHDGMTAHETKRTSCSKPLVLAITLGCLWMEPEEFKPKHAQADREIQLRTRFKSPSPPMAGMQRKEC